MGSKTSQGHGGAWTRKTRKRADAEHARKKKSHHQRQHLYAVKSQAELRRLVLASRHLRRP